MDKLRQAKRQVGKQLKRLRHIGPRRLIKRIRSSSSISSHQESDTPANLPYLKSYYEVFLHQEELRRRSPDPIYLVRTKIALSEMLISSVEEEELEQTIHKEQHEHLSYYTRCLYSKMDELKRRAARAVESTEL